MWVKQCHKPPIWEWFIPPIYGDLGNGLWHCFTHITLFFSGCKYFLMALNGFEIGLVFFVNDVESVCNGLKWLMSGAVLELSLVVVNGVELVFVSGVDTVFKHVYCNYC